MKKKIKKLPTIKYKFINSPEKLDKAFDILFDEVLKKDMKKLTNQDRFDILRGYYQGGKFHPKGKEGVDMDKLLHQMEFGGWADFLIWYKSLTPNDIKNGKKDWCSGDCCQSILSKLLKMEKIKELTIKMLEEENQTKANN